MLIITGVTDLLQGIMGIADDDIFARPPNYTFKYDVTGWGWFHLILGSLAILVGISLFRALLLWRIIDIHWRIIGVTIAGMLIITNFLSLPYYPIWSVIAIALYVFIIWALTATSAVSIRRTRSGATFCPRAAQGSPGGGAYLPRGDVEVHSPDPAPPVHGPVPAPPGPSLDRFNHQAPGETEARRLVAELAEQTAVGRIVPLHVQIVCGSDRGAALREVSVPPEGVRVTVSVHAPGLLDLGDMQQELTIYPGQDSDVLRFGFRADTPGLHEVTVRAYRGGTYLGDVRCQISVAHQGDTRDGPKCSAPLPSVAFDPGEVTLQVVRDRDDAFSFQLLSETSHAPESGSFRAGDPRREAEEIYKELRAAARGDSKRDPKQLRERLRNHGTKLWTSAVPEAVQRQFWDVADRISSFTVVGEHDAVPWELLYPLDKQHGDHGFLAEWVPVARRVFGQDRVRELDLPSVAFVVPHGSPTHSDEEVRMVRDQFGSGVRDHGILTKGEELTTLIKQGHAGALHFACHNSFTSSSGSSVTMDDGPFDPLDLAASAQLQSLRTHHPLVFFNACRTAGEISWFGETLGWAPQFLQAGAGAFIGTLWPVRSQSALDFADVFYHGLLAEHHSLGEASLEARQAISGHQGDPSWLAYAIYGSPDATAHITRT
ncbi:CHAT domain-containing protein [Streptomyces sp. f51]|uniref:CHAT domain-containing protein n=1 Tax=Streptomyces sp. f51 TaxID=1827742 RepID=UPI0030D3ACA7